MNQSMLKPSRIIPAPPMLNASKSQDKGVKTNGSSTSIQKDFSIAYQELKKKIVSNNFTGPAEKQTHLLSPTQKEALKMKVSEYIAIHMGGRASEYLTKI